MKKWLAGFFLFAALLFALPRAAEAQTIPAPVFKSAIVKTSSHVTLSWKRVSVADVLMVTIIMPIIIL